MDKQSCNIEVESCKSLFCFNLKLQNSFAVFKTKKTKKKSNISLEIGVYLLQKKLGLDYNYLILYLEM